MIKENCFGVEEPKKELFQKKQISDIERTLENLRFVATRGNLDLWMTQEDKLMNLIFKTDYGGLSSEIKDKYFEVYNSIIPEWTFCLN